MEAIRGQMTGDVDFPPNHQWTDRKPIIFPWTNMVLYGMGPALGLAAWLGWVAALIHMIRRRGAWRQHLLPVLWVGDFFFYQGTQWVKSMRYLLPIYPMLILLAAWLLVAIRDRIGRRSPDKIARAVTGAYLPGASRAPAPGTGRGDVRRSAGWRWVAVGLVMLVVLPTYLWAFAFVNIYRRPVTRVAAARWIYQNVPTAATLLFETPDGPAELPLYTRTFEYAEDGAQSVIPFELPADGIVTGVRMNHLSDPWLDPGQEVFRVVLSAGSGGELAASSRAIDLQSAPDSTGDEYLFDLPPTPLPAGRPYSLITEVTAGAPVRSAGAFLVNESSWDDGLPLRIDGLDGFSMYEGQPLELYWEDDAIKRERMVSLLDQGDFLFITSSRQLGSITRLPPRYPLTIAFYQALFDGRLGYELVETFMADLRIGPLVINDVFGKLGWGKEPSVGWPPPGTWAAEEAFSVYDHPPVWIFQKRSDYSSAGVRALLDAVDLGDRRVIIPLDYTEELKAERRSPLLDALLSPVPAPETSGRKVGSMFLPEDALAAQRAGGTWRELFDPDGVLSRRPAVGAAVWWFSVVVLGWLAFPIAFVALNGLPSKGYVVSKALALLVVSWLVWLSVSVKLLPNTQGTVWLAIGLMAAASAGLGWWRRRELGRFLKSHWRWLLVFEGVALLLFIIFLLIRSGNPDLWHPSKGGEKPIDLAFLNAVLRSTTFPPYDPWLAGAYINYYYYGYVLVGTLIKLLGIVPHVAYNLALPMLFSLTGIGAMSISFDLVEEGRRRAPPSPPPVNLVDSLLPGGGHRERAWGKKALYAGLVAAILAVMLGNLGQVSTIVGGWNKLGGTEGGWLEQTGRGLVRNLAGERIPIYTGSWYWDATRIIPPGEGEAGPITEFPFFTFLYADLHAHMIDMPLVLLALAWALAVAQSAHRRRTTLRRIAGRTALTFAVAWIVGGLAIGVLRATNTWDWPAMLGIGAVTVAYSTWRLIGRRWVWLAGAGLGVAALVGLSALFFLPFTRNFVPAYSEVMRWEGGITPVWAYFAVHGLFLFVLVTLLGREFADWARHLTDEGLEALEPWGWLIGLGVLLFLGLMAWTVAVGVPVGPFVLLMMVPAGLLAMQSRLPPERRAVLMLFALGLALTLAVEFVVLSGDISRMNTVFKFYTQVWLMFSAVGGAALIWNWKSVRRWRPAFRQFWWGLLVVLVFAAALYPPTAARAKIADRFHADQPPAGLDGMAYMLTATYHDRDQAMELAHDYGMIRWLQDNVDGSPVIMEANAPPYHWGNRISIYTGLPATVGWDWHTRQHRAGFPDGSAEVLGRVNDVTGFYDTPDAQQAMDLLRKYQVKYVIVGPLEQAYYTPAGLGKFDLMVELGMLTDVYRNDKAVIYEVDSSGHEHE